MEDRNRPIINLHLSRLVFVAIDSQVTTQSNTNLIVNQNRTSKMTVLNENSMISLDMTKTNQYREFAIGLFN